MWVNKLYESEDSIKWMKEFVEENTLSTLISHDPLRIAHMPIELLLRANEHRILFHVPIVDPIAKILCDGSSVTVIIHGPQQYISPNMYRELGLPTFNYGIAEITDGCRQLSETELSQHLHRLTTQREEMFATKTGRSPWVIDELAQQRFDSLLPKVAGFELDLDNAQVKLKMGQNRSDEDRRYTVEQLHTTTGSDEHVKQIMSSLL